ncbi:MAG: hypothetical protein K2N89_14735 [Lachnospiraceae bacterium]|nr:hypothetical protein [Lachnospiraceae bacterium]
MKKKNLEVMSVILLILISITGCTPKSAESENDIKTVERIINERASNVDTGAETENDEQPQSQAKPEDIIQNWDNMTYGDTVLMRQAQADQVCIVVQPSVLRKYSFYYYIPEDEDQKQLHEFMETLPLEEKPYEGKWEGMKEKGWQIAYQNMCFMVFEGGYLEYSYMDDETGELMEYFVEDSELCGYIQNMLQEKLNYNSFNPANIENIVSAKLDVQSNHTNKKFYSQTITDEETLQLFEDWFGNAEYILGGADCGNQDACLELELASGETVRLSVATDSCSNFGINGIYYDYRPASDWDNKDFFTCFDEIPWDWD